MKQAAVLGPLLRNSAKQEPLLSEATPATLCTCLDVPRCQPDPQPAEERSNAEMSSTAQPRVDCDGHSGEMSRQCFVLRPASKLILLGSNCFTSTDFGLEEPNRSLLSALGLSDKETLLVGC